jgi:hypothetical protein
MHTKMSVALAASVAMLLGASLHAFPASADAGTATITTADPSRQCVGDPATLTWSDPEVTGLTGFEITRYDYDGHIPSFTTVVVGPEERSLRFNVSFFMTTFTVRTVTSSGVGEDPFARASMAGQRAPLAMQWDHHVEPADVGDGFATVGFAWAGPVTASTTGNSSVTVRVTASPGGASVEVPAGSAGVEHTFAGLTNGMAHTFAADTFNACGSSTSSASAVYVPGIRPVWVQADPPRTVKKNKSYAYQFAASGAPAPTYSLVGAPAWLTVSPDGLVSGEPPKETTAFSFSVVADNGVGIEYPWPEDPAVAGPFTVSVSRGQPDGAQPRR